MRLQQDSSRPAPAGACRGLARRAPVRPCWSPAWSLQAWYGGGRGPVPARASPTQGLREASGPPRGPRSRCSPSRTGRDRESPRAVQGHLGPPRPARPHGEPMAAVAAAESECHDGADHRPTPFNRPTRLGSGVRGLVGGEKGVRFRPPPRPSRAFISTTLTRHPDRADPTPRSPAPSRQLQGLCSLIHAVPFGK